MNTFKSLLLGAVAIFFAFGAQAQSGLIARYLLNGSAVDAVGTNHGTVVGAVPTADRFGAPNAAYSFNGTSGRIEFVVPPLTQVNNWTISAWVKAGNFTQAGMAVYMGSDNGVGATGYGFGLNGSSVLQGFNPYNAGGYFSSGQSFSATGQWHHVVMFRGTGQIGFYLNGVLSTPNSSTTVDVPTDFTIGSQNGVRYFNGAIDDVRIFNRALTSNEVIQIYQSTEFCSPHAARADAVLGGPFVIGTTLIDPGCGYTNAPLVAIIGGGGSNATATATVTSGQVSAINIVNAGNGYTNAPKIVIVGPPFAPSVAIRFSKVKVTQRVSIGHNYVLQGSTDLANWTVIGTQFTAAAESIDTEVDLDLNGRYFRVLEVP